MIKLYVDNEKVNVSANETILDLMAEFTMLTREFRDHLSDGTRELFDHYLKDSFADMITADDEKLKSMMADAMLKALFSGLEDKS